MLILGLLVLAALLTGLALVLYGAVTNSLFARVLKLHTALMAVHRRHPAARVLTTVPIKALAAVSRYALWWVAFRRRVVETVLALTPNGK